MRPLRNHRTGRSIPVRRQTVKKPGYDGRVRYPAFMRIWRESVYFLLPGPTKNFTGRGLAGPRAVVQPGLGSVPFSWIRYKAGSEKCANRILSDWLSLAGWAGGGGNERNGVLVIENAYWMRVIFGVRVLLYPRYIISW